MNPVDADLKFGQYAVRMGMLAAQDLPKLVLEARRLRERSPEEAKKIGLGQLLVRKKLLTVSEYLYVAREVEKSGQSEDPDKSAASLRSLEAALKDFETGALDGKSLETILSSEDVKIEMPSREEAPPEFGRYELLEEIARGGMGIVYRARDKQNGQILALKVMIEADDDEARLQRFEREAELAKALDHPGIVKVYDAGVINEMPYFTMDLVAGKSLDDLLEQDLDKLTAIEILAQTARAVDHAHKRGIVHRDLKPGNILVDAKTGAARVTDFGLARDMDRNTRITRVGQAVGTPYYMAPEQVRGERDVDGRADTYAVGVMLYEVLTGDVPFDADSALTLFKKIDREPVNLPLDPAKGIDEKIHAITMRALQKKREDRYASSKLLADDLDRYLKGVRPKARVNTPLDDAATWLSIHKRGVAIGAIATGVVLAIAMGAAAIVARALADSARDAGGREARSCLERAGSRVETGERALAAKPAEARDAASSALDDLDRARELGEAPGPRGQGALDAFKSAGPGLRRKALWLEARALDAAGSLDAARAALEEAAKIDPPDVLIWKRLGELRGVLGDVDGALAAFGAAIDLNPRDASSRIERAEACLEAGQIEKAIGELSEALRALPAGGPPSAERVHALLLRSRAFVLQALDGPAGGRQAALNAAREDAEAAEKQPGTLPDPYLAVAAVHRARAALETSIERKSASIAAALEACAQAQAIAPSASEVPLARGDILLAHGLRGLALAAYDEAVRLAPAERGWNELLGRGIVRAHRFALDEARADLEEAARRAARAPLAAGETTRSRARVRARIATELSDVLLALGDAGAARSVLEAHVRGSRVSPAPLTALASLELAAGERDAALAHLDAARAVAGTEGRAAARVHEALARVRLARRELPAALDEANVAAALCGQRLDVRVRRTTALCRAASAADEAARATALENARLAWSESFAVERDAFEPGARPCLDLATTLLADGADRAALARDAASITSRSLPRVAAEGHLRLEAALRVDPLRAPALAALAELALARGRPGVAVECARRCRAIDPVFGRGDELVAEAALALGDAAGADAAARHALALSATTPRLLLAARAAVAKGDAKRALALIDKARGRPLDDEQEVELDAVAAAATDGPAAADRLRVERAAARGKVLADALAAEANDPDEARAQASKLARERAGRLPEARGAFLVVARLTRGAPADRIVLLARAAAAPEPALLDAAHVALASSWRTERPSAGAAEELAAKAESGDATAAVALGLLRVEQELARRESPTAALGTLPTIERAVHAAPASLAPRLAHALESLSAEDTLSADEDLALLREVAPESAVVLRVAALVASARGDRDLARDLDARAKAATTRSP